MKKNTTTIWKKVVASSMALLMVASGFALPVNPTLIRDFSITANAEGMTTIVVAIRKDITEDIYIACDDNRPYNLTNTGQSFKDTNGRDFDLYMASIPVGSNFAAFDGYTMLSEKYYSSSSIVNDSKNTVTIDKKDDDSGDLVATYSWVDYAADVFEFRYEVDGGDSESNINAYDMIHAINANNINNPIGITVLNSDNNKEVITADEVRNGANLKVLLDTSKLPAGVYIRNIAYTYDFGDGFENEFVSEIDDQTGKLTFQKRESMENNKKISIKVILADSKPYEYPADNIKEHIKDMVKAEIPEATDDEVTDAVNNKFNQFWYTNNFKYILNKNTITLPAVPLEYWYLNPQANAFFANKATAWSMTKRDITFYNTVDDATNGFPFCALILDDGADVAVGNIRHVVLDKYKMPVSPQDTQFAVLKGRDETNVGIATGTGELTVNGSIQCYNYAQFGGKVNAGFEGRIIGENIIDVNSITVSFSDKNSAITPTIFDDTGSCKVKYFNVLTPLKYVNNLDEDVPVAKQVYYKDETKDKSVLEGLSEKRLILDSIDLEAEDTGAVVDISLNDVSASKFKCTGKEIAPTFTVKLKNGTELKEGEDYEISGTTKATDAGTYKVKIKGIEPYKGEITAEWTIGYKVAVENGEIVIAGADTHVKNDVFPQKKTVTVVADSEKGGWYIDDKLVSTQKEYTFYVTNHVNLEWKENTPDVSADIKPVTDVELSDRKETANNKVSVVFGSTWQVPEGATVKKAGIYRTFIANDATKLPTQKEMLKGTFKSVTDLNKGNYCFILNMGTTSASKKLCAMSFVQYELKGKTYTVCSNIVTSESPRV